MIFIVDCLSKYQESSTSNIDTFKKQFVYISEPGEMLFDAFGKAVSFAVFKAQEKIFLTLFTYAQVDLETWSNWHLRLEFFNLPRAIYRWTAFADSLNRKARKNVYSFVTGWTDGNRPCSEKLKASSHGQQSDYNSSRNSAPAPDNSCAFSGNSQICDERPS